MPKQEGTSDTVQVSYLCLTQGVTPARETAMHLALSASLAHLAVLRAAKQRFDAGVYACFLDLNFRHSFRLVQDMTCPPGYGH